MKVETKVGLLFVFTVSAIIGFSYYLGALNPFSNSKEIHLMYNFAGGIEVGSPVRVMGIKVGKVTDINFQPGMKDSKGEEVNLKLTISVNNKAWKTLKVDSKFYINLAGVIGERYIEVTPGSLEASSVEAGAMYRGTDPPRIDQLISQSYSLAGKILQMVEDNEDDLISIMKSMNELVGNLNKTIKLLDKMSKGGQLQSILVNLNQITGDVASISGGLRTEDTKKTLKLIQKLIWRLDGLDKEAIKKFLQEEGIKAKLF